MQAMDQKQKNKYITSILFNIFIICGTLVALYIFVVPLYDANNLLITSINASHTALSDLRQNGIQADQFASLAAQYDRKKELSEDIFFDKERLNKVLRKPTSFQGTYLAWTTKEA